MKSLRFVSFLVIAAAWFGVAPSAQAADGAEGKFHLVYLVSTDKVEVGAKAYVEPLFFTDGNRLVFAYDYCRQYFNRMRNSAESYFRYPPQELLSPNEIADDLTPVHRYCNYELKSLKADGYIARDASGTTLSLSSISFATDVPYAGRVIPPAFPDRGIATIRQVSEGAVPMLASAGKIAPKHHHFLMSNSKSLLDSLAPVREIGKQEPTLIQERVLRYVEQRVSPTNLSADLNVCAIGPIQRQPPTGKPPVVLPKKGPNRLARMAVNSFTSGNVDQDDRQDFIVAFAEETPGIAPWTGFNTTELRLFLSDGTESCLVWYLGMTSRADAQHFVENSRFVLAGPVQVGTCRYLITSFQPDSQSLDLVALPRSPAGCRDLLTEKYREGM